MDVFAQRLKERARQLGISNRQAARLCGLEERRYSHYAGGRREPDLETVVRIATALSTTPNWLLGIDPEGKKATKRSAMLDRLVAAAREMSDEELRVSTVQAEALVHARLS
jgi:transcriptional regulator with XRE-family HTH domain